jgi:hypothetical protein
MLHADLATPPALTAPDQERATALIEIAFGQSEGFPDAQPGSPHDHDQPAQPAAVRAIAGGAHHGDDLLELRRIGRGNPAPCCLVRDRRGIPASSPAIDVDRRGRAAARA